jgi:transcriptional regulator with XRE-family HTH domain
MTPAQCRASRALLDWSQVQLSEASGVGIVTVRQFEAGNGFPRNATVEMLMNTLERAGVEFLAGHGGGPGVRLREPANSQLEFLSFLKLYERNRLRSKARHTDGLPQFGFCFVYTNRDGADLMFNGAWLGKVRWQSDEIQFDPPVPRHDLKDPTLSDTVFDRWVSLADHRYTTGHVRIVL